MHLAASKNWIVRRDLQIKLSSTVFAEQSYAVDINMDDVLAGLPPQLKSEGRLVWLPILRIPSNRPNYQRIVAVTDGDGSAVPTMPQADVRNCLAAGLAWLMTRGPMAKSFERSGTSWVPRMRKLHDVTVRFLETGDPKAFDLLNDHRADDQDPSQPLFSAEFEAQLHALVDGGHAADGVDATAGSDRAAAAGDPYMRNLMDCMAFARVGYFAVVGLESGVKTPRIRCQLLPAELETRRPWRTRQADEALGFKARGGLITSLTHRPGRVFTYAIELLLRTLSFRAATHLLRIPLPEIADSPGVHVQIEAPDDVCVHPAVLHHDADQGVASGKRRVKQSRVGAAGNVSESPLHRFVGYLEENPDQVLVASTQDLLRRALDDTVRAWAAKRDRIKEVERLSEKFWSKGRLWMWHPRYQEDRPTELRNRAEDVRKSAHELSALLDKGFDRRKRPLTSEAIIKKLRGLVEKEERGPHIEMTADDDPRDNVAHFYLEAYESVFSRLTDSRPVVKAIIRASKQAREDFMRAAMVTCVLISALLSGVIVLLRSDGSFEGASYNAEALAALLLLVPGIAVSLLPRVPGDSLRHRVGGRSVRWAQLSLIAPVVAATFLATRFEDTIGTDQTVGLGGSSVSFTDEQFWWFVFGLSWTITLAAVLDQLMHRGGFNYNLPLVGSIRYAEEPIDGLHSREDFDVRTDRSQIDSRNVVDLTGPMLFEISNQRRRFKVTVRVEEDRADQFLRVLQVLEGIGASPQDQRVIAGSGGLVADRTSLDEGADRAAVPAGLLTVESSLVTTVATTGTAMVIVSCESGLGKTRLKTETIEEVIRNSSGGATDADVTEIEPDSGYFLYDTPEFSDFYFRAQNEVDHHDPDGTSKLERLVSGLLDLEQEHVRRISYLHCPIRPSSGLSERQPATLKVGFAFGRAEWPELRRFQFEMNALAQTHGFEFSTKLRRLHPDDVGAGGQYTWASGEQGHPKVLVSTGRDELSVLRELLADIASRADLELEGGTVLTVGGYAVRALRVWHRAEKVEVRIEDLPGDWRVLPSGRTDPVAEALATEHGDRQRWRIVWARWQLPNDPRAMVSLLEGSSRWLADTTDELKPAVNFINLEYLSSHLNQRRAIVGKAKFRIGLADSESEDAGALSLRLCRSLESYLQACLQDHLNHDDLFVLVDETEPMNPRQGAFKSEFSLH